MTQDKTLLELEGFLPYRLNVLAESASQSLAGIYRRRYRISVPEWRIMATLGQFGAMTAKEIGQHSRMHKTKVSRAAAALEERHMILRTANTRDMRESFLDLTPRGTDVYRSLVPEARKFVDALLNPLDESERLLLDRLLTRLTQQAELLSENLQREASTKGGTAAG